MAYRIRAGAANSERRDEGSGKQRSELLLSGRQCVIYNRRSEPAK